MGMDYDTPLLTGAQLVTQTGVQALANLETSNELDLDAFALAAHQAIWRKLKAAGEDPPNLTNAALLKDAVAYEAIGRLALAGYLGSTSAADMFAKSEASMRTEFRAEYASAEEGRTAGEGVPSVGHADQCPVFSDDVVFDDLPTLL